MAIPLSDAKLQALQDQVNAKIHWDAPEHEVEEWLEEKHGITGDEATVMIAIAGRKRRMAVRERGLYSMGFGIIGMVAIGIGLAMDWAELKMWIAFGAFLIFFLRGLARVLSGQTDVPID